MSALTFSRAERLKSKKEIETLLSRGRRITSDFLQLIYSVQNANEIPVKAAFSAPKKKFKRSVDRNLIKRRMREGYRLNKHLLAENFGKNSRSANIMFVYLSDEIKSYREIEIKIVLLLNQLLLEE